MRRSLRSLDSNFVLTALRLTVVALLVLLGSATLTPAQTNDTRGAVTHSGTWQGGKAKTVRHHRHRRHHKHMVQPLSHGRMHMPPPGSNGEEPNTDWYRKRAWPNTEIDPEQYPAAVKAAQSIPIWGQSGKNQTLADPAVWQMIGPNSIGGRVSALAVDPKDSNVFYAGAANGGVWRTLDHGKNWLCITDTFAALSTGAITIDPNNTNIIYLGQGECDFSADSYPGNGLWRSTDRGATWAYLGLAKTRYIAKILIDPSDANTLYVAAPGLPGSNSAGDTNRGVYKSTDGGLTWLKSLSRSTTAKNATTLPVIDLAMNPHDRTDLVAFAMDVRGINSAGGTMTGLWHTTNAGTVWRRIDTIPGIGLPNGVTTKYLSRGALAWIDSSGTSLLYAAVSVSGANVVTGLRLDVNFYGLYRSIDPDHAWTKLQDSSLRMPYGVIGPDSTDILYRQGDYNFYLAANPWHPNELYIGGIDVQRSTDYGRTFHDITIGYPRYFRNDRTQHSDQHALAFTPATTGDDLLLGSDGGVFSTRDFGTTWEQLKGLPITMFYGIEGWWPVMDHMAPITDPTQLKLFGGTQDNGTVAHGFSANSDWDWINRGDGGRAVASMLDSNKLFTSQQLGGLAYRDGLDSLQPNLAYDLYGLSPDNYNSKWHWFSYQLLKAPNRLTDTTEVTAFIAPMVLDQITGKDIYTARVHIYHAKFDFVNKSVSWSKWSPVIGGKASNPKDWTWGDIECMAVGPHDAVGRPILWAGGAGDGAVSLWRTTVNTLLSPDSAPTWIRVTGGLPANYVSSIAPDRSDSLVAFASVFGYASGHVFKTTDGGKTWKSISGNLPNISVNTILIDTLAEQGDPKARNNCIFAATDVGVFVTVDGGKDWYRYGAHMPAMIVHDIKQYKQWLVAATDGRSAWAVKIDGVFAYESGVAKQTPNTSDQLRITQTWPEPVASGQNLHLAVEGAKDNQVLDIELVEAASGKILSVQHHTGAAKLQLALPSGLASGVYFIRLLSRGAIVSSRSITVLR